MRKRDIRLVNIDEAHLELIRGWRNSPEVSQYMYTDKLITEDQQKEWFKKIYSQESSKYWLIEYNENPAGLVSITDINPLFSSCYWAFYLGDTSHRGAGLGARVEYNILDYVFNNLQLNKLRCEVFSFNEQVIKMHEKFGFRREAYYREHCLKNGKFLDVVGLAILKSEWKQLESTMRLKIYGE